MAVAIRTLRLRLRQAVEMPRPPRRLHAQAAVLNGSRAGSAARSGGEISCQGHPAASHSNAKAQGAARKRERQMADVLWRKAKEGAQPAWNYLGRVARKGSANAHHCSIMLRVCKSAEDLQRLEHYIAEHNVAVDEVLLQQLHRSWLQAGCPGSAVRCLMTFAANGADTSDAVETALSVLLKRAGTKGASDYLAGLVVAGEAKPHHLWAVLKTFGSDRVATRRYLLENYTKLTPVELRMKAGGDDNLGEARPVDLGWARDWVAALHNAWVRTGELSLGANLLCRAVKVGALTESSARQKSVLQVRKMQQHRSTDTANYLLALHQCGLVRGEHFVAALTHVPSAAQGRALLNQMKSLEVSPNRDIAAAFHDVLVRRLTTIDSVETDSASSEALFDRVADDDVDEAARWLCQCVHRGHMELEEAAAAASLSLSSRRQNLLSDRENAWRYFNALVRNEAGVADSMNVLGAMARKSCKTPAEVQVLAARVDASANTLRPCNTVVSPDEQRPSDAVFGYDERKGAGHGLHQSTRVPAVHAIMHDAWLGVGTDGVGPAVDALSDAIRSGTCTPEEAGRIATAALERCRGNGDSDTEPEVTQQEYFDKLQQVGIANGIHFAYMLRRLGSGLTPERTSLLAAVGRVARVSADSAAFALLMEHASTVEQLRDLWTEMAETGVSRNTDTFLGWHRAALRLGDGAEAAHALLELSAHYEYTTEVVDNAQRHATTALRRLAKLAGHERAHDCANDDTEAQQQQQEAVDMAWMFYTRLWEADLVVPGGPCIANAKHASVMRELFCNNDNSAFTGALGEYDENVNLEARARAIEETHHMVEGKIDTEKLNYIIFLQHLNDDIEGITEQLNSVCCADPNNCADGFPRSCDASCAAIWLPFAAPCGGFVSDNFPNLVAFSNRCNRAGPSQPAGPPPPPQVGTLYYASGTLTMTNANIGNSAKRQNRFKQNLRADLADALSLDQEQILITALSTTSVTIEIFAPSQAEVQAATSRLTTQLSNPNSVLLTGSVSSAISPNQRPNMQVQSMGGGGSTGGPGMLNIRIDDTSDGIYFNGNLLGTVDDEWELVQSFPITAACGQGPNVLAVHGIDAYGSAAILASWEHCGVTTKTDMGCKCTTDDVSSEDWTSPTYDDSAWPAAADGGINGADPWGEVHEVDMSARWIWASNLQDTDEAYCRCTEGHPDNGLTYDGDGQFHIRVDDTSTLYVNGQNVGETHPSQWTQVGTFEFNAPCDQTTVYAVDGSDAAGVSAFIGDINHCGQAIQTLPNKWKCSIDCPSGWEQVGFDDSQWPTAVDAGINGVEPWGATDVSPDAHWIWTDATTQGSDGGWSEQSDRACCRYETDHHPINCNAARMQYMHDYMGAAASDDATDGAVTSGDEYAFSQYTQTGQAAGYIWHSELCNDDGSDIDHDFDDATGQVHISVDNGFTFYVNEQEIGTAEDWYTTQGLTFTASCDAPTIYAIDAYDLAQGPSDRAALIASINHCGESILTGNHWKCEQFGDDGPPNGWMSADFDDSGWNNAGVTGGNGANPWGLRPDISVESHWIWTADPLGHEHVYCRYLSHHVHLDCPAAQARYWQDYRDVAAYDGGYEGSVGMEAWDHYQRYGMNEGRIWHSELCETDGTNKFSECEIKHTSDQYEYDYLTSNLGPEKAITFSVKCNNDAHIGFFETTGQAGDAGDFAGTSHGPQYEIVLSGWGGTQSVIREAAQGENHATTDTTGYLNPNDFRQFWASAANGLIRLGAGNIVGFNVFMQWQDPDAILDVTKAAVATGWGNEGDWVVCLPEQCSGWFDATVATLSAAPGSGSTGPVLCTEDNGGAGAGGGFGTVDAGGCDGRQGAHGGGYVDYQAAQGDRVTFDLSGCEAGAAAVHFKYQLGDPARAMTVLVNGAAATMAAPNGNMPVNQQVGTWQEGGGSRVQHLGPNGGINFAATGGWGATNWGNMHTQVRLNAGHNTITLETSNADGNNNPSGVNFDRMQVQAATPDGTSATQWGRVYITADNGYILYVNGDRVGAGGAALPSTDPNYEQDGWKRIDYWGFTAPCTTPTSFAVEAVDSEGIAAMIASTRHCGTNIVTNDQWKCSPVTPFALGADRTFHAIDTPMDWTQANQYCTQHYGGLASIHNAEEQQLAREACGALVTTDEVAITDCTSSSQYSDTFSCEKAYDNDGQQNRGEFATASEFGGWIQMNFAQSTNIGSMAFQQRWAEIDWCTSITLQFSDGSTQEVQLQQDPSIVTYQISPPKQTSFVKITFTTPRYPQGAAPPAGYNTLTGNTGAKEIQFFEDGVSPHGCWIGLNDNFQERRLSWTDGSAVDFQSWAPGEPNDIASADEDVVEMDFRLIGRCTGTEYAANQANGCQGIDFRNGEWNDNQVGGDGGNNPEFPLCQSAAFQNPIQHDYVGCYTDSPDRDMQGIQALVGGDTEFFDMGENGSPDTCASLCAGFAYFGLQYGSQCFCDNANAMVQTAVDADTAAAINAQFAGAQAADSECNSPCTADPTTMCGGTWRNSIYRISTNFWEMPGFDDSQWAAASDLGANGVAPWRLRDGISDDAHWIWSSDPNAHDHIFCRHTQPNTEMNCPAAQAEYLHEHPWVKNQGFPAWQHYQDVGKRQGMVWHEELCNTCTPAQMESHCDFTSGVVTQTGLAGTGGNREGTASNIHDPFRGALCQDNLCSNKCVGKHDAAQAELVGARIAIDHNDHYGTGFADYQNPTGDTVTFTLNQCRAGRHLLEFTYSLASDRPDRPLRVTINGGRGGSGPNHIGGQGALTQFTLHFPATGSWEEWGTITHRADLLDGTNTITLTAMSNSGPNLDMIEVFPNGHSNIGIWRGNFDNSGTLYVNNQAIVRAGPTGVTGWDITNTFTFTEPCDSPTVYAIHALDAERDEDGQHNVGGIIGSITHCNEVIVTNSAWKCVANDIANGYPVPTDWNEVGYDDSGWEKAKNYGIATGHNNHWNEYTEHQDPPYHVPRDAVDPSAHWIWTSESDTHDDVYCRYESFHTFKNCRAAADRYYQDYPDVDNDGVTAWHHFNQWGKDEGRIWHSELCFARCEVEHVAIDWVDASVDGIIPTREQMRRGAGSNNQQGEDAGLDDAFFEVELPFQFPFYGQMKSRALISTNGYLTFSGEHTNFGNTASIPNPVAPNDMIAPFWSDLDLTNGGQIYTLHVDGASLNGANSGSCKYGIADGAACCALTCGTCGGTGCEQRPGGESSCCYHAIAADDAAGVPLCRDNLGRGPCKIDEDFFVIQWDRVPFYGGQGGTNTFQVILYENGAMRFQYQGMGFNPQQYAIPVSGIENAAGSEGLTIADCHDPADVHALMGTTTGAGNQMHVSAACQRARAYQQSGGQPIAYLIGESCASQERSFSIGWCDGYQADVGGENTNPTTCGFADADRVCQDKYGGQLASIENQDEYDTLNHLITGAITDKYMLGLHSDGQGHWENTDGTPADMDFLRAHSSDGLAGVDETQMVFYPQTSQGGAGGFHDCCNSWIISGFVCEFYAAEGQYAIGLGRTYDEAEDFCQAYYGGHLASIHNQRDYDKIADLAQHYTQPLMLGLRSDGAGNWAWEDGTRVDTDFLIAHSFDGLNGGADFSSSGGTTGTDESVGVFYPPVCQSGWDNGVHQDNTGDGDTCDGDSQDPEHFNHALHDWGNGDTRMAFVCSASGQQRRMHLGSGTVPGYNPIEVPGCTDPAASNYDPAANVDDGSCRAGH